MAEMTSHERFLRTFKHMETDRVVIWDFPWPGTMRRWYREGIPKGMSFEEYFDVDVVSRIIVDNSPRYPERVIREDDERIVRFTNWGGTEHTLKNHDSTPEYLDFTIRDMDTWLKAKERMLPTRDRVPWDDLQKNYGRWRKEGHWILGDTWYSFNQLTSYAMGMEQFLIAMVEEPDLCIDMLHHTLDVNLALLDMAWDAGYTFDMLNIRDDMGYNNTQFYSITLFREIIRPVHQKAVDWAKRKGIRVRLHSCGYIMPLLPDILDIGFEALHGLEVKAGMDAVEIKRAYGDRLVLHGGFPASIWLDLEGATALIKQSLPILMKSGGYVFATDHSIPNNVPLQNVETIIKLAKEIGRY
ncbi:MAG: hypothetical protein FWF86_04230 [Clostridia bacterium]|nr:hypothetical protein [Clostridia bacterium]